MGTSPRRSPNKLDRSRHSSGSDSSGNTDPTRSWGGPASIDREPRLHRAASRRRWLSSRPVPPPCIRLCSSCKQRPPLRSGTLGSQMFRATPTPRPLEGILHEKHQYVFPSRRAVRTAKVATHLVKALLAFLVGHRAAPLAAALAAVPLLAGLGQNMASTAGHRPWACRNRAALSLYPLGQSS